jgi:hypothetical protein
MCVILSLNYQLHLTFAWRLETMVFTPGPATISTVSLNHRDALIYLPSRTSVILVLYQALVLLSLLFSPPRTVIEQVVAHVFDCLAAR